MIILEGKLCCLTKLKGRAGGFLKMYAIFENATLCEADYNLCTLYININKSNSPFSVIETSF